MASPYVQPVDRIESRRRELGVDAVLVHDPHDIRWACGFTGSNGLLLWTDGDACFVTDGRYAEQATREVTGARIDVPGYDLLGFLHEASALSGLRRVAFSADTLTVRIRERLQELFPEVEWIGVDGLFRSGRAVKADWEVDAIRRAQALSEQVLSEVLAHIKEGVSERDLAAEIACRVLRHGADGLSFDPIVASGARSALPHARPTSAPIRIGDPVLLDFGCVVDGYASDMTRMVCLGPPPDELSRVYGIVLAALESAESTARSGVAASAIDQAARRVISDAGFGDRFPHSLGHGVGLAVHEAPAVSWRNPDPVSAGAVITLEPGVYLPGQFGVRIEDLVLVTDTGVDRLTAVARDLIIV